MAASTASSSSLYNILLRESKKAQNDNPIQTLTSIIPSTLPHHTPTFTRTVLCRQRQADEARLAQGPPISQSAILSSAYRAYELHTSMDSSPTDEAIMAALLRLSPQPLNSLGAELRLRQRRLSFLLLSPPHFSLALSHLRSLSLGGKTILLARLLLRSLSLLQSPLQRPHRLSLRDFDAAVLLLAMCDSYDPSSAAPGIDWRSLIADRIAGDALCPAGLGGGWWPVIAAHLDAAVKCRRLVEAVRDTSAPGGAAAAAAMMSLAVAEIGECAICEEEIVDGGAMPCGHPFHWGCILEWLRMRNTCPCCRFELPTADIYGEIQRVWKLVVKMGG